MKSIINRLKSKRGVQKLLRNPFIQKYIHKPYQYLYFFRRNYIFRKNAHEALTKFTLGLNSIGKIFWADFGTLLGIIRDNNFLPKDLDLDVGMYHNDYSESIETALKEFGFTLIQQIEIDNGKAGLEQTFRYKKGVTIDIFYFIKHNEMYKTHSFMPFKNCSWTESIINHGGVLPIEQYFPLVDLSNIEFQGIKLKIPVNVEEYLAFHYGGDYLTPRSWNYMDVKNDNVNSKLLLDKIGVVTQFN